MEGVECLLDQRQPLQSICNLERESLKKNMQ